MDSILFFSENSCKLLNEQAKKIVQVPKCMQRPNVQLTLKLCFNSKQEQLRLNKLWPNDMF